ncbi:MAG: CBS domain-containing protein [Pseudomonadales bacterium]|nr:CBS domain-containing protein [Gammaproteobacteria bacterium]
MKNVHDVLKRKGDDIWSIRPVDTVFDAISMMADREVGALLVMIDGQLVGIISERDYARKVILQDKNSKQTRVSEIMTRNVITVTSEDHIEDCVVLMKQHHIRHLPVIDAGIVAGVVSLRDLFTTIIDEQAFTIEQLEHYIRGEA